MAKGQHLSFGTNELVSPRISCALNAWWKRPHLVAEYRCRHKEEGKHNKQKQYGGPAFGSILWCEEGTCIACKR